jgi:2-dehydropantoate 2-reductase
MSTPDGRRIAVLAPGGIGAPIGGLLTQAGHDVVLIDQWVQHVEAMRAAGLRIEIGTRQAPEGELVVPVRAHHLYELAALRPTFDVVFLTAKSYDTAWLVELIRPYLAPDGVLVSVQNSLNEEWIAPVLGAERVVGCVLTGGGELLEPGHVWRNRSLDHPYYTLGELDGQVSPRLTSLVELLSDAGKTTTTTNLLGAKWTKLIRNSQSSVASLCGRRSWSLLDHPAYIPIVATVTHENLRVGRTCGYRMEPINGLTADDLLGSPEEVARAITEDARVGGSDGSVNHVSQDLRRGRKTEVTGFLNGLVVRKGHQVGIPTPVNETVIHHFDRLERGLITADIANLDLVAQATPA